MQGLDPSTTERHHRAEYVIRLIPYLGWGIWITKQAETSLALKSSSYLAYRGFCGE